MVIDAHTHLFPPEVIRNRAFFARRDPAFRLLYGNEKTRLAGPEDLLENMDRQGIDISAICGFPWADPGLFREGNDFLWDCRERHPRRFLPLACFPFRSLREAEKERDRCLARGFAGFGELGFYHGGFPPSTVRRLAAVLNPLKGTGVPVLLHVNEPVGHEYPGKIGGELLPVYRLLQALPGVVFILAHWGGGFFFYELMPEVARAAAAVYYDTAASPFLYRPLIYPLALRIVGARRLLFGSDYPLLSPERYFSEMHSARLGARDRRRIQGLNARRLFLERPPLAPEAKIGYNKPDSRKNPAEKTSFPSRPFFPLPIRGKTGGREDLER